MEESLRNLSRDIVKLEKENDFQGFIKTNGKAVLIRSKRKDWRTPWPYVAYLNLEDAYPVLEYRTLWSSVLWLIALLTLNMPMCMIGGLWVAFMMIVSHRVEKQAIYTFIQRYALEKAT